MRCQIEDTPLIEIDKNLNYAYLISNKKVEVIMATINRRHPSY
jgi:hypothetical protein